MGHVVSPLSLEIKGLNSCLPLRNVVPAPVMSHRNSLILRAAEMTRHEHFTVKIQKLQHAGIS